MGWKVLLSCFLIPKVIMQLESFFDWTEKCIDYVFTSLQKKIEMSIFKIISICVHIKKWFSFHFSFIRCTCWCVFMKGMKETFIEFLYFWLLYIRRYNMLTPSSIHFFSLLYINEKVYIRTVKPYVLFIVVGTFDSFLAGKSRNMW